MQKDCHYYGTYYMATQAGFSHEEAEKIAWAAQSVDEMTHDFVRSRRDDDIKLHKDSDKTKDSESLKKEYTEKYYNVVTTHDFIFYLLRNECVRQDTLLRMSKQIESVWSVFHFMPANLSDRELNIKNRKTEINKIKTEENDPNFVEKNYTKDLKMVCKPSSTLANQVFQFVLDFVKDKATSGSEYSDDVLYTIGIFMHVIADTWSHQDFCGSNDMLVNHGVIVENGEKKSSEPNWGEIGLGKIAWVSSEWFNYTETDTLFRCFSAIWTGHGSSGSYPDIPGKTYTYIPDYTNTAITVNNPERYRIAFAQMYYIMKALREKNEYTIVSDVDIPDTVKKAGETCFTDGEEKDRCKLWDDFLDNKLKEYDKNDERANVRTFLKCAHDYRTFVLNKIAKEIIGENDYYKDVESLTIKELMSSKFEDALEALGVLTQYVAENGVAPIQERLEYNLDKIEERWDVGMSKLFDGLSGKMNLWDDFSHDMYLQDTIHGKIESLFRQ